MFLLVLCVSSLLCLKTDLFADEPAFVKRKMLLICLDGATWDLMRPLIEKGSLPHFAKLIKEGVSGELLSEPAYSPPSWTTIATGKIPEKHGVMDFSDARNRKARYIWSVLSDFNIRVGIMNWKMSLIERINGFMYQKLSPWEKSSSETLHQEYYPAKLDEAVKGTIKLVEVPDLSSHEPWDALDRNLMNISEFLINKYQPDFVALGFFGTNNLQHRYWSALEPQYFDITLKEVRENGELINNYYRKIDNYLDYFIKNDYTIIFVSDHGFSRNDLRSGERIVKYFQRYSDSPHINLLINRLLERAGLLKFIPGCEGGGKIDLSVSQAYFYNNIKTRLKGVRINRRIVKEDDGIKLEEKIYLLMKEACFDTGERIFLEVVKIASNKKRDNPDIIFNLNPIFRKDNIAFEESQDKVPPYCLVFKHLMNKDKRKLTRITLEGKEYDLAEFIDYSHDAVHAPEGVIIMAGSNIRKNEIIKDAKTKDITPTILYLFGLPVAEDMDGRVLSEAIEPEFIEKHPKTCVGTYERKDREFYIQDNPKDEIDREKLRSLGYAQ